MQGSTTPVVLVVAVCCGVLTAPRVAGWQEDDGVSFSRFRELAAHHGHKYSSLEEEAFRFRVWQENIAYVAALNSNQLGATFTADGPYGDLTTEEFAARLLMPPRKAPQHPTSRILTFDAPVESPHDFDWRAKGAVTPVRDQGFLGSCWAFSTAENLEGQLFLTHGELKTLSVEQLIECDASADPKNNNADCGEFGGWPYLAYDHLSKAGGIYTEEDFPYCSGIPYGDPGNCMPCMPPGYSKALCGNHKDLYCNKTTTKGQLPDGYCQSSVGVAATVTGWNAIASDEDAIAKTLIQVGPLSAAVNAALLQFYWGGIYDPYDYWCDPETLDHAVLLVGYGAEDGKDYWIVKNSWGDQWGEAGYFRIKRGSGKCGINTAVTTGYVGSAGAGADILHQTGWASGSQATSTQ